MTDRHKAIAERMALAAAAASAPARAVLDHLDRLKAGCAPLPVFEDHWPAETETFHTQFQG